MSTKETGGPAFPLAVGWVETDMKTGNQICVDVRDLDRGMSLRDYFAAKFICGRSAIPGDVDADYDAALAYKVADAMLKERAK